MNNNNNFIIKIEGVNKFCIGNIVKITGHILGKSMFSIIDSLDLDANPRSSRLSDVTEAIQESIANTPDIFAFKTKGILLAFSDYESLERSRFRFNIANPTLEGILDGGHNTLAVGLHMLKKAYEYAEAAFPKGIKAWREFKKIWEASRDMVEDYLDYLKHNPEVKDLDYYIPVEVIVPRDVRDEACVTGFINSLFEICYARNNNAQLVSSDKANHRGYYDELKTYMEEIEPELAKRVIWKSNSGGTIKAQDIIALSLIPLNLITPVEDEYEKIVEPIAPQKLYSAKGSALQHFERIMGSSDVTKIDETDSKNKLINNEVSSALKIAVNIPRLYDYIYEVFPALYNKAGGSYGNIKAVSTMNKSKKTKKSPFMDNTIDVLSPDGFIMPVVYGLQTLMKVEEVDETRVIKWSEDPMEFLKKNLGKIVELYTLAITMCDFDPQKVGKSSQAYQLATTAYKTAINGAF